MKSFWENPPTPGSGKRDVGVMSDGQKSTKHRKNMVLKIAKTFVAGSLLTV